MNKKISRLFEPSVKLYLLCLLLFSFLSFFVNYYLFAAEMIIVGILYLYFKKNSHIRKRELRKYVERMTVSIDSATKDSMLNFPLPIAIFYPDSQEIIWSNAQFLQIAGEREHIFEIKLSDLAAGFQSDWLMEGKTECPTEVTLLSRRFLVYGYLVPPNEGTHRPFAMTYWVDITGFSSMREEFRAVRPVVGILMLDNYEELFKNLSDTIRSEMLRDINVHLTEWTAPTGGLLCRYDRGYYLFLFEERYLSGFIEQKFQILDTLRAITNPSGIPATLSIGIGRDAPSFAELFEYASLSVEMALSRGGDQVVSKDRFHFEFYGGHAEETEKRTKVKSRVMANALSKLISDASCVFAMGHKHPDLDAAGACAGVCAIARKCSIPAYIIFDPNPNPAEQMVEKLRALPEYEGRFITAQDALVMADSRSLLVVVDTNRPEQVESENLLLSCNRVAVIDHHRRAATYITNAVLNFHEPSASSACELVSELLLYIVEPSDLLRTEAEAMLAGIVLDSKNFTARTGSRTFEAAAFLRHCGADAAEVRKLFKNSWEDTLSRYEVVKNAQVYRETIAIAAIPTPISRVIAAQAADELLGISGIDTSFVLFPLGEKVAVSARASGKTNVQVILEAMGGGGNAASAGAELESLDIEGALKALKDRIDRYFEEG